MVRVPEEHYSHYQAEASSRGMPMTRYARQVLAGILELESFPSDPEPVKEEALLSA